MKRALLVAFGVLAVAMFVSGAVFEWLWLDVYASAPGPLEARLDEALFVSTVFDVLVVGVAATVLTWPLIRRVRHLQDVAQRQRSGDLDARARMTGSDALSELGETLDALADANAQHLDNQRALLRAVSHELRTPVARLRFALAELVDAESSDRVAAREQADTDIDELDRLIDEVLGYVRVGPGGAPMQTSSFDLMEMLRDLARDHSQDGVRVDVAGPSTLPMVGEPHLVQRAVANLLRNACTYAQAQVHVTATSGHTVVVADDGPGLPPDADARLLLPFVRHGDGPGTGLGLSIAETIAQRHGGNLCFDPPKPGEGAVFRLHLPQSRNAAS